MSVILITKDDFLFQHYVDLLSLASTPVKFSESYRTDSAKDNSCYWFT